MATPGANLSYHNTSRLFQVFLRRLGFKPRDVSMKPVTRLRNLVTDDGTQLLRAVGICAKFDLTTPPTTNAPADAPTGRGDLCVMFFMNNQGVAHIPLTSNIAIYRCTAYTNSTTFTWAQIA